jgi:Integrase core domain
VPTRTFTKSVPTSAYYDILLRIKWHRGGFRLYWRWKSKAPIGRPQIDKEIRELIRRMSRENPLWGVPRIQSELRLLGFEVVERLIGSIRRECLDHLIIIGEDHLRRILREYFDYYHHSRPHQSLGRNSPIPREIEPPPRGKIVSIPQAGGLHHLYRRAA